MFKLAKSIFRRMNSNKETSLKGFLFAYLFDPNLKVHILIEKMRIEKSSVKKLMISKILQRRYGVVISPSCYIGNNLLLPHPVGIVIGRDVIIGDNCIIYQNVTLGQKEDQFPVVGDNVTIFAGAQIIGNLRIGSNAIIGANAVVLKDVPESSTAVGVPARIIRI